MAEVSETIKILKKGGMVIFPTETAFGIGCRMDNKEAVRRLMKMRRREKEKPFLVLVSSIEMAKKYLKDLPSEVKNLMRQFWPGPLTVVYFCRKNLVPSLVRAGGETLGVRMPDHEITLKLVKGLGVPLLAPSANFAGEPPPFKFSDLNPQLKKEVDFVLKAPCGQYQKTSTVIDCTQKPWKILREGAIKGKELFNHPKNSSCMES